MSKTQIIKEHAEKLGIKVQDIPLKEDLTEIPNGDKMYNLNVFNISYTYNPFLGWDTIKGETTVLAMSKEEAISLARKKMITFHMCAPSYIQNVRIK